MPLSLRHAAATDVGRVRRGNEDSFYADDETSETLTEANG